MVGDFPVRAETVLVAVVTGGFLLLTSGVVVRAVINSVEGRAEPSQRELDVGAIVGVLARALLAGL